MPESLYETPVAPVDSVHGLLLRAARTRPDREAIAWKEGRLSYAELAERARRLASSMRELPIKRGYRVGLLLNNTAEFVIAFYGAAMAGAVVVPIDAGLSNEMTGELCRRAELQVLITDDRHFARLGATLGAIETLRSKIVVGRGRRDAHGFWAMIKRGSPEARAAKVRREDPVLIAFTSGTTGRPRGAILTHGNVLAAVAMLTGLNPPGRPLRRLPAVPLSHAFGLIETLNLAVARGDAVELTTDLRPAAIRRVVEKREIARLTATPALLHELLECSGDVSGFGSLERVISGGAPLAPEIRRRFRARFGVEAIESYGLAEAASAVCGYPSGMPVKSNSIGVPLEGVDIRIVDFEGNECAIGEVGEIVVRGPNVMRGYWRDPAATRAALRDGWLHTGDLGYVDDQAYYFILDRHVDTFGPDRQAIYSREIEDALYALPEVRQAAVFASSRRRRASGLRCVVSLREGARMTADDIEAALRGRLAEDHLPQSIEIVDRMPTGATGKILKRLLRENG